MNKRTLDYQAWKLRKLGNPKFAADYINEAAKDSPAMLLKALKNVAQAREVAAVAKEAGVARENLYRAFSAEGNPTYDTLTSVLNVLGLRLAVVTTSEGLASVPTNATRARPELGSAPSQHNPAAGTRNSPETIGCRPRLAGRPPSNILLRLGGGLAQSPGFMRDEKWRMLRSVNNG